MNDRQHHAALACGFALAALLALTPAQARASFNSGWDFGLDDPEVATGALVLSGVVFGVTDVAFLFGGRPMPPWLAIVQIGVAGLLVPTIALASSDSVGARVGALASMAWFNGFAIHDLVVYPDWKRERERKRQFGLAIEPRTHGGVLRVYSRF